MTTLNIGNGRSLKAGFGRRAYPYIVAFVVMALIATFIIILWARNSSRYNDYAPEEELLDYLAGKNFADKGFLQLGFLTDNSLDDAPDAPPVHYTHQPPLPIIFIGVLIKTGIKTLPEVRLVMILIFLAGLAAMMAFFWRLFTPWHGIAIVALFAVNGRQVLPLADHTTHSWWLLLSFLTLWAISHPKERTVFFWLAVIGIFLTSLTNYIQLIVLLVTLAGLWLVRVPNFTFRRVLALFAVAAGGVALHIIQNIIVIRPSIAFQDIILSFGNRVFADPTREALRAFSQQSNLILWGVGEIGNASNPLVTFWREYAYYGLPVILSLAGLIALVFLRRLPSSKLALRMLAVFILASFSFHVLLPAASKAYFLPFGIAIPIAMVEGLFVGELITIIKQQGLRDFLSGSFAVFIRRYGIVSILLVFAVNIVWLMAFTGLKNLEPAGILPVTAELQILNDFKGEGMWTNITPQQVAYYTHSWVIGQVPLDGLSKMDISQAFVVPVSNKSPTWQKVNNPHYFFFAENNVLWFLPDTGPRLREYRNYLEENYPVVARSAIGTSFVVDMSIGPTGTSRILEGRQHFDVSQYQKIAVDASRLNVSSFLNSNTGKENLVKTGTDGFWHVKVPREENPAWLSVDFSQGESVALVRLRARSDYTLHLWDGNKAVIHASNDGQNWVPLALLGIDRVAVEDDWITFQLLSPKPYRYYRLSFYDMTFLSLGRIEFYRLPINTALSSDNSKALTLSQAPVVSAVQQFDLSPYTQIPLNGSRLEVSSIIQPALGKDNLVRPDVGGFWHVIAPRQENPAWLTINMTGPQTISVLRLKPRDGYTGQLWNGSSAVLYVSNDGQGWQPLATLSINRLSLVDEWVYFSLPTAEPCSHLKLSIYDMSFYSIARIELYQKK
jgi:hypothetical protein